MTSLDGAISAAAAVLIEFGGSVVIAIACLRGLAVLAAGRGTHARQSCVDGWSWQTVSCRRSATRRQRRC